MDDRHRRCAFTGRGKLSGGRLSVSGCGLVGLIRRSRERKRA